MIESLLELDPIMAWVLLGTNAVSIGILWFTSRRELLLLERQHREDIEVLREECQEEARMVIR
jgi:hypothetical protein